MTPRPLTLVRSPRAWLTTALVVIWCLIVLVVWAGFLHATAKDRFVQLPPGASADNDRGVLVGVVSLSTATTRDDNGRQKAPIDGHVFVVVELAVTDTRAGSRAEDVTCDLRLVDDGPSTYIPVVDAYSCGDGLSESPTTVRRIYEVPQGRVEHVVGVWNRSSDLSARAGKILRPAT